MSDFQNNAIFWIEVEKIQPNPYQPRREFNEARLSDLADSIRQYGVLQPLVVTRQERERPDGGIESYYELIAGERRLRASRLAGVSQVPALIKSMGNSEEDAQLKLELAIIENVQREDLNPVERARAFKRLVDEFRFKHTQVAEKVGKSREYVSNSIRLLALPELIQNALLNSELTEGHARPLMMLVDHPEEQDTLYKDIVRNRLTVRDAERIARHVASDRVRKKPLDPVLTEIEGKFTENLGTRVRIETREHGGKLTIDFASVDDLRSLLDRIAMEQGAANSMVEDDSIDATPEMPQYTDPEEGGNVVADLADEPTQPEKPEKPKDTTDADLYSIRNFSI